MKDNILKDYVLWDYDTVEDKRAVMLNSGGLDSCVLAHLLNNLGYEVHHLYVWYGNKTSDIDATNAKAICNEYGGILHQAFIDLPWLCNSSLFNNNEYGSSNFVVPMRNSIFLSIAWSLCESLGFHYVAAALDGDINLVTGETLEEVPDAHITFARKIREGLNEGSFSDIKLLTPFIGRGKPFIVQLGVDLGTDFTLSRSCYNNFEKPCGVCGACKRRAQTFELLGIKDPIM